MQGREAAAALAGFWFSQRQIFQHVQLHKAPYCTHYGLSSLPKMHTVAVVDEQRSYSCSGIYGKVSVQSRNSIRTILRTVLCPIPDEPSTYILQNTDPKPETPNRQAGW